MKPESVRRLAYVSVANGEIDDNGLSSLMRQARKKNKALNVTGLMLVKPAIFLQVLEGPPETIEDLMNTIANDDRHKNIDIIYDEPDAQQREFSGWRMDCLTVDELRAGAYTDIDARLAKIMDNAKTESEAARELLKSYNDARNRQMDIGV